MAKTGRPTDYTEDKAAEICAQLGEGLSLKEICEADDMPFRTTVYKWLARHKEFSDMYARAREEQADTLADEIMTIADEKPSDAVEVQHSRLRIDARKWVAAKLKPRLYGDKVTTEHTGSMEVKHGRADELTDEELDKIARGGV